MTHAQHLRHQGESHAQQLEQWLLMGATAVLGVCTALSMVEGVSSSFTRFATLLLTV